MKYCLWIAPACLALGLPRPLGALPQEADGRLQIRASELWLPDGKSLANGVVVIEDGRIRGVGSETALDRGQPLIEHAGVLTPGFVACQTGSGAKAELFDETRSVLPEAQVSYAFDPAHSDFERALEAGITTVLIAPSGENLVGGLTCAVKTAGGTVVSREASLAVSFSAAALGYAAPVGFQIFGATEEHDDPHVPPPPPAGPGDEPPYLVATDGSPETTSRSRRGAREPTSYAGALAELKRLFEAGEGSFARATRGELPVHLEAWDRHEVVRAAEFARRFELRGAIRGAPLAGDPAVVAALRQSGLGVILGPYGSDQTARSLETTKLLGDAGIPVAFALEGPARDPLELRLSAVRALRSGAPREAVRKCLTSHAALLAGVAERVGALEAGRDADFVLWSGDPLNLASRPLAVFVDGKLRWRAPERAGEPR